MAARFIVLVCFIFVWFAVTTNAQDWTSPCPEVFEYRTKENIWNTWYGTLTLISNVDVEGVWIRMLFDGPVEQLMLRLTRKMTLPNGMSLPIGRTWVLQAEFADYAEAPGAVFVTPSMMTNFGRVSRKEGNQFLITNSNYILTAYNPVKFNISVQYNSDAGELTAPRLSGFRLNAMLVCPTPIAGTVTATKRPGISTSTESPRPIAETFKSQLGNSDCGKSSYVSSVPLILGGWDSTEGEWPWHSAIYKNDDSTWSYICGGTIIAPKFILTAAHCVVDLATGYTEPPINFLVYVGTANLKKLPTSTRSAQVAKIHPHPKFSRSDYHNDIALLQLGISLEYDKYIRPVCLWEGGNDIKDIVDELGTVVGWGRNGDSVVSNTLKKAQMPVVAHDTCFFSRRPFFSVFLNQNSYCAGYRNGTSVCNGDSGSGMVFEKPDGKGGKSWYVRGLVSLSVPLPGSNICNPLEYMIFTDIAKHLPWIKQIMSG